ncbi:MAG: Na/Pi cotransporter family protein [bacterium]|nr:Na/Pi cotransporter family protein [bacterium]
MNGTVLAAVEVVDAESVDVLLLVVGLVGGLAIFLLGMDRMTDSLKLVAGARLRGILLRMTSGRLAGLATGAGITALVQSSSVTTVLLVGFVTSGLIAFEQTLAVILGANIGSTVTAQLIAFKVTTYALLAVAAGFAMSTLSKKGARQTQGTALMGLGLVFFGMSLMSDAMEPLRSADAFIDAMARLENPVLGIAVGAAFTAVIQSSAATTGIVIVLAQQGLISLDTGIALILGANIGTSATALLAALGKTREALRVSVAHTLFNIGGVLLWLPLVGVLARIVESMGGGTGREIANAHTIFNTVNAFLVIGFVPLFARFVERLVKDRSEEEELVIKAKYLDEGLLRTPTLALDRARLELLRMASRVRDLLDQALPAVLTGDRWMLLDLEGLDEEVDALHGHVIGYLGKISQTRLSEESTKELLGLMEATNDLEAIGDLIETNLVALGLGRIEDSLSVSPETTEVLTELHAAVAQALDLSMMALTQKNTDAARRAGKMKKQINSMERAAAVHQASRLVADAPDRIPLYQFEMAVITVLKRIYYFSKRIARVSVPDAEKAAMTDA